jgi:hypothetical protein
MHADVTKPIGAFFKILVSNAREMCIPSESRRSFVEVMTGYLFSSVVRFLILQLRPPILNFYGHVTSPLTAQVLLNTDVTARAIWQTVRRLG